MSENDARTTAIVTHDRKAITVTVAERYGMEADAFEVALRNTVFLEGSRAEYAAFLVVCNEYKLNPLTKEIYAFKNKQTGKVVPVVSIDGWVTLCNTHPAFDGMVFEDNHDDKDKLVSITCTIYRKDRAHPTEITEYLSECSRDTAPWKMVHRMLRHKSLMQCARYAFGFSGIYDEDDAEHMTATLVPEGEASGGALLASDFDAAPKPKRAARKPGAGGGDNPAAEPEEASHARQGADDDVHDAEFEDGAPEERPITAEADTPTGDALNAEGEPAASGSASPASDASQAPPDTIYTLKGDEPGEDGKIPTYKDGVAFSRVKPDAKVCPAAYDRHAPAAQAAEPEPGPKHDDTEEEPGGEFDEEAAAPEEEPDSISDAIATIREAPHYPAARQVQKNLQKSDAWALATNDQKKGIRLAMWTRYKELFAEGVEKVQPFEDFALMRMFIEFGATTEAAVDVEWGRFIRHAAYKDASEADRAAMTKLKDARKAELKPD